MRGTIERTNMESLVNVHLSNENQWMQVHAAPLAHTFWKARV